MAQKTFSLDSRYLLPQGTIILSGIQALVRLPLDQHRADRRAGLNTATFISGYRGSPLGGLDLLLQANRPLLDRHQVVFVPGVNEELGATAVWGSQIANLLPRPRYDGVLGMWYGKAPGVDRSGDALKHANFTGVGRHGGVLAIAGDDPVAKSSTLPSQSEVAFFDAQIPVLYPGTVQEIIELGRLGFELSRYSGLWVGLKLVTDLADAYSSAEVQPLETIHRPAFDWRGRPWQHHQNTTLVAPYSLQLEQEIHDGRLQAARHFAAVNGLNAIPIAGPDDWLGLVAAGKTYRDVREALDRLGLNEVALRRQGIRILKLGLLYPLEDAILRQFARGLKEILVVEEKRAFLEMFVRDRLYPQADRPGVLGKADAAGAPLIPAHGELNIDTLAPLLHRWLAGHGLEIAPPAGSWSEPAWPMLVQGLQLPADGAARQPYFCSGCPHNRSTRVPAGSLAGGGIGCHGMALMMDRQTMGITHMGGEGAQWVGASFFSETPHLFQNLGDGTLFHSGTLAIRQAVAAGTRITYKILYNAAVAMTGGQVVDGSMPVPELTRALQAEGVARIIVCADDPDKYPAGAAWADGVTVWPRERLDEAQAHLRDTPGVTALIYDQHCAADLRRRRRRGEAPEPAQRVFINEAVCEGCGDCGVKSNCLSVFPVETEFGRKTRIHQSSCNKDYTCLEGDCPALVTVVPGPVAQTRGRGAVQPAALRADLDDLPEPPERPDEAAVYLTGIGGTGVVTVNQILATAAMLEGKQVQSLDQTGLSQKGGPVVSHLKVLADGRPVSSRIARGSADLLLVFDVLTGTTDANLDRADPARTVAVVSSSQIPTGKMVTDGSVRFPQADLLRRRLEAVTRPGRNVYLDAVGLAEHFFGSHLMGNIILVGAAYQAGLLPIGAKAIDEAIGLNGVAVTANRQAFALGRLAVARPEELAQSLAGAPPPGAPPPGGPQPGPAEDPDLNGPGGPAAAILAGIDADGELKRLLARRVPELIAYQGPAYARDYAEFVQRVWRAERERGGSGTPLSEAVARYLFKLMAYKDEYEVARLYLQPAFAAAVTQQFGRSAVLTYHLHPPFMRALGLKRKLALGSWFRPGLQLLAALRRLRGTPLDLFGYNRIRRLERALIQEYRALIAAELARLTPANRDRAVRLAQLPDMIRGYEGLKLDSVAQFRQAVRAIQAEALNEVPG